MRAAVLHGGGELRQETVPDPVPAPDEVVVRVRACSICGSDVHAFRGRHPRLSFPRILGHEFAGEIVALGGRVRGFRAGERVCCDVDLPCGACGPCRAGRSNICERLKTMGFDCDGAYAEYVAVPEPNLYRLPEGVGFDQAAAVQVLGISYHAVAHRARPRPGEKIAVIGAGPVGLGAALVAREMGAEVAISDVRGDRLAKARELGIGTTLEAAEQGSREAALALTRGRGFDHVIECVGGLQERSVADAVAMVKRGGKITIVGTFPDNRATIPIAYLKDREIDITFSRGNFRAFPACIELIASGRIDPRGYISHRLPLARAAEALALLEAGTPGVHKIVLEPWTND